MRETAVSTTRFAAAVFAILLGGCGMSDERRGKFVSDPAQYELYTCDQLGAQEVKYA